MRQLSIVKIPIIALSLLMYGCSNSRHLPAGESLFRGSKVHINDDEATKKERKVLNNDLAESVRPRPNSKTLGVRLKLTLYNAAGDTKKKKGIRPWLRNKVGEPPVLASSVNLNANKDIMVNLLQNKGFFEAKATAKMETNKSRKSTAVFEITTGPQYTINKVYFKTDSTFISHEVDSNFSETLLTPGTPYNLDLIKAERNRIDRNLKNLGFFYFRPDYVLVVVDSSIGDHKVNMYVKLKHREIPEEVYKVYKLNDIYVYTGYRLQGSSEDTSKAGAVTIDNYNIIDNRKRFNPKIFPAVLIFEKGDIHEFGTDGVTCSTDPSEIARAKATVHKKRPSFLL